MPVFRYGTSPFSVTPARPRRPPMTYGAPRQDGPPTSPGGAGSDSATYIPPNLPPSEGSKLRWNWPWEAPWWYGPFSRAHPTFDRPPLFSSDEQWDAYAGMVRKYWIEDFNKQYPNGYTGPTIGAAHPASNTPYTVPPSQTQPVPPPVTGSAVPPVTNTASNEQRATFSPNSHLYRAPGGTAPLPGQLSGGPSPTSGAAEWNFAVRPGGQGQPTRYGNWKDLAAAYALAHGGKPEDMINRVQNVYMTRQVNGGEGNLSPTNNGYQALGNAIADDKWAEAFTRFTGNPPGEVEWREHAWNVATNGRTRDPLEGHEEALQWLKDEAKRAQQEMEQQAQQQAQEYANANYAGAYKSDYINAGWE